MKIMKLRLLFLSFKNIKVYYFIPLFVIYVFVPFINYLNIRTLGVEVSFTLVMDTAQMLIPITSTWWIFCVLKEYIEGDGNELLYAYENVRKTKVLDILIIFLWYCLHIALLFIVYSFLYDNIFIEYIRIIIQSFVLTAAFYFLIYAFKSTSISYMFILAYYMMTLFFSKDTLLESVNMFSTKEVMSLYLFANKYFYVLLAGIIFLILGMWRNKHYYK